MEKALYLVLVVYFLFGAFVIRIINKKKTKAEQNQNWLKYFTYLFIVNGLFAAVIFKIIYFHYICLAIIVFGYYEIFRLIYITRRTGIEIATLIIASVGFYLFFRFSTLDKDHIFFVLALVSAFDAFSQLTGQFLGKRKLLPIISPNKTTEGLMGGYLFSMLTAVLMHDLAGLNGYQAILLGFGIATFAFLGDVSASFVKRKFGVKDFSALIPGHGGFLDRFDSLIFAGSFMYLIINYL